MTYRTWTDAELEQLRQQYATRSNAELAIDMGRTRLSVYSKAQELELHKGRPATREGNPCRYCGGTTRRKSNGQCINARKHAPAPGEKRPRAGGIPGARAAALEAGEKKYEGRTCADCGGTVRFTSNRHCICTSGNRSTYPRKRKLPPAQHAQGADNYWMAA